MSNKHKTGFTIIEVMLFLAISGLMFVGLVANTSRNIASQRFSASIHDFSTFMRKVYNEVEDSQIANRQALTSNGRQRCTIDSSRVINASANPDLPSSGRSECSVYGKLVTFGENEEKTIHVYDVIGDVVDSRHPIEASTEKESYNAVSLGVLALDGNNITMSSYSYTLDWDAWVEDVDGNLMSGAFLIVRSPLSGVVHTYYRNYIGSDANKLNISSQYQANPTAISVDAVKNAFSSNGFAARISQPGNLNGYSNSSNINICINSEDRGSYRRGNYRIMADARNSSDLVLVSQDGSENQCID